MVGWIFNPKKKALQESANIGLTWIKSFGIFDRMVLENEGGIYTPHQYHLNCLSVKHSSPFSCKKINSKGPKALNLQQFKMIFLLIGAGYTFASLSFTLEVLIAFWMRRYKVDNNET